VASELGQPAATQPGTTLGAEILSGVRARIDEAGLDAIVAMSPENLAYCAGAVPPSLRTVRQRLAAAVIGSSGPTDAVVVALEAPLMRAESWMDEVTAYVEFEEHPIDALAAVLQRRGLGDGRVGIELTYLPATDYERLARALPDATLVSADGLLADVRVVKTPGEIELIRRIGGIAERTALECCALAGPGMTERELGNLITERYTTAGGDRLSMLVVGSGPRSAHPNAPPTDRRLEHGDVVRLDIIGTMRNYYSDVARTAVVGGPTDEQKRIYRLLSEVHERALEALRPGVQTADVYRIYREAMEQAGLPPYHFVGHGLGVTLHEEPFIHDRTSVPLEENMVLCIEPLTFIEGQFGVQIEDEVLITSDGHEPLTRAGADFIEIGAGA
jgi:Xaa-Pro dipeptidase